MGFWWDFDGILMGFWWDFDGILVGFWWDFMSQIGKQNSNRWWAFGRDIPLAVACPLMSWFIKQQTEMEGYHLERE